ncbi:uncharacterized protein [Onthophagus taurus]|uniref:uncharacterized protein isoform X2 n=1 Tax=Onthophagus taurus TaxID=166361 RepID=UPI0039BE3A5C
MRLLTIGLIVSLLIHYSEAANCVLDNGQYTDQISIYDPKMDDSADVFLVIPTTNVQSAEIKPNQDHSYIDVVYSENTLTFRPSAEFRSNWEKDTAYTSNPRVNSKFILTCADGGSYEIEYIQSINDLNTFDPVFVKATYDFTIPMPVGGNVDLTNFGEAIFVTDYDVSNEGMSFTIEGDNADSLVVEYMGRIDSSDSNCESTSSMGKTYKGILKTKSPLRLTEDTSYTITATDKGKPSTKSGTATLNIIIDQSGTLPSSPSFETGFYEADYDKSNPDIHSITLKNVIKVTEGITTDNIQLSGEHAGNFEHTIKDNALEITLKTNLPDDVINFQPFVALSITASIDSAEVVATTSLIVTMPEKDNLSFTKVYYETQYSEIEGKPQIDTVDIQVTDNAVVEVIEDYAAYFKYNPDEKTIEPTGVLPSDVQSNNDFIHVTIKATLGIAEAEAVLIVKMPDEEIVKFGEIYYEATYSEESGNPTISEVKLDISDEAIITLGGDLADSFTYNTADKTITVTKPLPLETQPNNFIHVTITATLGESIADAILIVTWPREEIVEFGQVYYEATYSEESGNPTISEVKLDITDEAIITFGGDLADSFTYNTADKTITVTKPLPLETQPNNFIHVTITATLGESKADAVLIVTWPREEIVEFGQVYYEATYSEENGNPTISEVKLDISDEAIITLGGDLADSFTYNSADKTITVTKPLPLETQPNNFIHVTITATLGESKADAVLIVTWPREEIVEFGQVYYEATYSEESGNPTISEVKLDITDEAIITFGGDLADSFTYNTADKTITVNKPLPLETQPNNFIHVTITATLGGNEAEAVLIVSWPKEGTVKFGQVYYEATYSEDSGEATITPVTIDVTDGATIEIGENYAEYFKYNPDDKTIEVTKPLLSETQTDNNFIHVTITAKHEGAIAEAVLIVNMPGKESLRFNEIYYEATYSEEDGVPTITPVIIEDLPAEVVVEVIEEFAAYFAYNAAEKTIEAIQALTSEHQTNNFIHVKIRATLGAAIADAILIVNMPDKENLKWKEIYYEATYSEEDGVPAITPVTIEDLPAGVTVEVVDEFAAYFTYNAAEKTIEAIQGLTSDHQANNFIHVKLRATLGAAIADAILIVNMPGKENLRWKEIYYEAAYSEEDGVPAITPVTIEDLPAGVVVEVIEEFAAYFAYNAEEKTIEAIQGLTSEHQANNFIHVKIRATLGAAIADAILIVNMPDKENLRFKEIYYETTYSEEDGVPAITPVIIEDLPAGVVVEVIEEFAAYFAYNAAEKTIEPIQALTSDHQANNFIHVKLRATLGSATADAILIVNMPDKENLRWKEVYYEATYSEEDGVPAITPVTIEDLPAGVVVEVIEEFAAYFAYNAAEKTIEAIQGLTSDHQANNFIHVKLRATLGSATADAILIVNMPGKENLRWKEIYYEATYSEEDGVPAITPVTIEDLPAGVTVEVVDEFAAYFAYNAAEKTIEAIQGLTSDHQANNFIHVKIRATLGAAIADAILIVNMPGKENLRWKEVYYEATYSEEDGVPAITPVIIEDLPAGVVVEVVEEFAAYFAYNAAEKTIEPIQALTSDHQANNFIHVKIRATLGAAIADAILIVNMPGKENLRWKEVYYEATYSEEDGVPAITPVTIEDLPAGVVVEVIEEFAAYFAYNAAEKTIEPIQGLTSEHQANNFIHVKIRATLGAAMADAILIVNMPGKENLRLKEIYYEATYSEKDGVPAITPVTLEDLPAGVLVEVIEEFAAYFAYNAAENTIEAIQVLTVDHQANNFIHVKIQATLGGASADAILIVNMPDKVNLRFKEIYYEATYSEEDSVPAITPVTIEDLPGGVTVEVVDEFAAYFAYNAAEKTIEAIQGLTSDHQANNFIHVKIRATLGAAIADAILIVNMPGKENLRWKEVYYEATYSEEDGVPAITPVTIEDLPAGVTVEVVDEFAAYFAYNAAEKTIEAIQGLTSDHQANNFIHVKIRATLGAAIADAILIVNMPGKENLRLKEIYYEATYSEKDGVPAITPVIIEDLPAGVVVEVIEEFAAYFAYNAAENTIEAIQVLTVDHQANNFIHVKIQATLGGASADAILIVNMPDKVNLRFKEIYYEATYSEEDGVPAITPVTIEDLPAGVTVEVVDEFAAYFAYNAAEKTIEAIQGLTSDHQANNFIHVKIRATLGAAIADAILIVNMPGRENLRWKEIYYEATYSEEDGVPAITPVTIEDLPAGVTVEVVDEFAAYFAYNAAEKTIEAIQGLTSDHQANNFIHVKLRATLGAAIADAILIVNMPGKENLRWKEIYYEATYSEEDGVPAITPVIIEDLPAGVTVEVVDEFAAYFAYNAAEKTIEAIQGLTSDHQANNFIHVKIRATLGAAIADAILIVNMPGKENLRLKEIYYEATYSEKDGVPAITPVTIEDLPAGVVVEVIEEFAAYFAYNAAENTIEAIQVLTVDHQANNFIHVKIQATLGGASADAILIVNMPDKVNLRFKEIYYEATYSEEDGVPAITPVTIEDLPAGVTVEVVDEFAAYFAYNAAEKTIEAIQGLTSDHQANNFIHVKIRATLGAAIADAILIVNMPGKENLRWKEVYYEATYSEEDGVPAITPVIIEDLPAGVVVEVIEEFAAYFAYNAAEKTIVAIQGLTSDHQANNFIHVKLRATLGSATADAILIVNMPGKENLRFKEIYYEATYSEEDGVPAITPVTIEDLPAGVTVEVVDEFAAYFAYNAAEKTIEAIQGLTSDHQANNFIHVKMRATLGAAIADAILIVNMPGKENLRFKEIYYEATYSEKDGVPAITPVTIEDLPAGVVVEVIEEFAAYFAYNAAENTIEVIQVLTVDHQANNFIHVKIQATLGGASANAILIVNMPDKVSLKFNEIYYEATYSETDGTPAITEVLIGDLTPGAIVEVVEDYADYFTYNAEEKTIEAVKVLTSDAQSKNFIHVKIRATLGAALAEAVLIVNMPADGNNINNIFNEIYYEATYSEEDGKPKITQVNIKAIDEATVQVVEDYQDFFEYNPDTKTIEATNLLTSDIQSNKFIHVTIRATLEENTADAVLIVNMPNEGNQINGIFGEIYYEASYFEEDGNPKMTDVKIDVIDGANVEIIGEYKEHFEYDADKKSIKIVKVLDINSFEKWYIDVIIRATLEEATADAVLVVSPTAIITFEGELVFEGEPSVGISGKLTAKSSIDEEIVFRFTDNVPQEWLQYLSLTDDGTLKTLDLPTGSYDIEVVASGTTSKASQITLIKIRIGSAETCPDGTIWNPYTFLAVNIKENEEESVVLPLNDGSEYHYEIVDIQPNKDRFELNGNGDVVAKSLDRESDEFGSGKAQYIAKINLISNAVQRRFSPKSTLKTLFVLKDETTAGDDKCYSINKIGNEPNQIVIGISVDDVNDNKPIFEKTKVVVGYPESDLLKTVSPPYVIVVKATDKDIGDYASLKYSVTSSKVVIDENTGYIYPTDDIYENDEVVKVTAKDDNGKGYETEEPLTLTIKILEKNHLCILKYQDKHLEDLDDIMDNLAKYADVRYLSAAVLPGSDPYGRSSTDRSLVITAYAFDIGTENLLTAEELIELLEDVDGLSMEPLPNPGEDCTTETPTECNCDDDECSNGGLIAGVVVLAILLALCIGGFIAFYILIFRKTKSYNQMEEEGLPKPAAKETPLENPKFIKNPAPLPPSNKLAADIVERRPTGYLYPADLAEEEPPSTSSPSEVFNNEMKERRKSVVFNNNIEEINIEREAEDQDGEKKNLPDEAENTKL